MLSGLVRWFDQHVEPVFSSWASGFVAPLIHDVETAGGQALAATVQAAANQVVNLAAGGTVDLGKVLQAGINAGKAFLVTNGIADLEHAAVGAAAAVTANIAATVPNSSFAPAAVPQASPVLQSSPTAGITVPIAPAIPRPPLPLPAS